MHTRALMIPCALALIAGCGGGGQEPEPRLRLAGTYPTAVAISSDACGGSVVQDFPTTVQHAVDAATLRLLHAGSTYDGTVTRSGSFTTVPLSSTIGDADFVVAMTGQFSASGFTATVNVDRTDDDHPDGCRYVVQWTATRSSGTNEIPD